MNLRQVQLYLFWDIDVLVKRVDKFWSDLPVVTLNDTVCSWLIEGL